MNDAKKLRSDVMRDVADRLVEERGETSAAAWVRLWADEPRRILCYQTDCPLSSRTHEYDPATCAATSGYRFVLQNLTATRDRLRRMLETVEEQISHVEPRAYAEMNQRRAAEGRILCHMADCPLAARTHEYDAATCHTWDVR